ncbi:MAG: hypothetical protein LBD18_02345, partial [Treponema sp.]|nr:hypothetical protein [Treponema sp.]
MKNLKDRANKLITVFAVFALALCAAGCNNILQPKAVSPGTDSGKGLVQIHIGTVAGRTLLPAQTDLHINQWVITFTAAGSNQRPSQTFTGADLSQPMQVEEGEWALSLEAKKDGTVIAGGTASSNITVITGQQVSATVTLVFTAPGGGAGSLEYTITNNSGITPYSDGIKIELTPLSGGGTPETIGSTLTGTKSNINAGYYLVSATLSGDGKKALKSDVAHIYKGQTTKLNWTF